MYIVHFVCSLLLWKRYGRCDGNVYKFSILIACNKDEGKLANEQLFGREEIREITFRENIAKVLIFNKYIEKRKYLEGRESCQDNKINFHFEALSFVPLSFNKTTFLTLL